jgi:hypothetical protein
MGFDNSAERRCEECGELLFFNHSMSSSGGDLPPSVSRHTHGYGPEACELAAEVREQLPVLYDMAIQSLVMIEELLGRFVCGGDDEEWEDPKTLQRQLLDAYHLSSEGVRTESRWRESAEVSS